MGRTYWDKKETIESCLDLNIGWLKKYGYLRGYKSGGITWTTNWGNKNSVGLSVFLGRDDYVHINYVFTKGDTKEDVDYKIRILSTPCNYGGMRYWLHCPLQPNGRPCRRRVTTLYLPPGCKYFGCRHCYNLSYESRNMGNGVLRHFRDTHTYLARIDALGATLKKRTYAGKITRKYKRYQKLLLLCDASSNALQASNNRLFSP